MTVSHVSQRPANRDSHSLLFCVKTIRASDSFGRQRECQGIKDPRAPLASFNGLNFSFSQLLLAVPQNCDTSTFTFRFTEAKSRTIPRSPPVIRMFLFFIFHFLRHFYDPPHLSAACRPLKRFFWLSSKLLRFQAANFRGRRNPSQCSITGRTVSM